MEDLINNIEAKIGRIPVHMLVRVNENFRKRMQQCVDSEGRHLPDTLFETMQFKNSLTVQYNLNIK